MKKVLFFILFLLIAGISYADDISISANVDSREISLDSQVTLVITVSGSVSNIPQPNIPSLDGFTAYSSGRSQNISIINSQVSSSVAFTYILVPNDVGEYSLGPFTIDYKGNTYSTDPINIKVTQRAAPRSSAPSYASPQTEEDPGQREELFIETYVDKLTSYVNEQITLTFAFYQAVNLFENPVYNPPSTTGFWTEDMPPQKKYYKIIGGKKYLVTEIKTALFATSSGEFTIGGARLEASIEDLEKFYSRNPFDIFGKDPFSMFKRGKPVILTTDPITVDVLPLPDEGKPVDFKGDIGIFDISVDKDTETVEENQPVSLKVTIKGKGNIKTISSPDIPETDGIKFYDSGSSENISKSDYIVQGEKIFEKVIIPKRPGAFTIGPIKYSYFDPAQKRYVEKTMGSVAINAIEAKEPSLSGTQNFVPGVTKEEVKLFKKDICYIKTRLISLRSGNAFLYKNKIFLAFNILPLFFLLFLYIYELHRERLRSDVGYARSLRARGLAAKRLKQAKKIMRGENVKDFYAEIYRAVIEYIADKSNIPHPSITKALLEDKLKARGVSENRIEKIKALFDICDMARFASGGFTGEDMLRTLEEAADIIAEF